MKPFALLPVALGFSDGILNTLALAAGRLVDSSETIPPALALRIAAAAGIAGIFMLFVAEYARAREDLARAEFMRNMGEHGRPIESRQGARALHVSAGAALVSGGCAFSAHCSRLRWGYWAPSTPVTDPFREGRCKPRRHFAPRAGCARPSACRTLALAIVGSVSCGCGGYSRRHVRIGVVAVPARSRPLRSTMSRAGRNRLKEERAE